MAEDKKSGDFNYKINDLKGDLKNIVKNGWEVSLHGGEETYVSLKQILEKKKNIEKLIGKKITGYRSHRLAFKTPKTWEVLSQADFKYDSTFGYADMVGFRNGMCHPFYPFNLKTNKKINILEIPLTVMDGTLFDYMKIDVNVSWKIIKQLIDVVEKNNGVISILWHNTTFVEPFEKWGDLYKKILDYCYKKNAWLTSGENIYQYYNKLNNSFWKK